MTSLEQIGLWLKESGIDEYSIEDNQLIYHLASEKEGYVYRFILEFKQRCFMYRLLIVDKEGQIFKVRTHRKKAMRYMLLENDLYVLGRWCYDSRDGGVYFDVAIPAHKGKLKKELWDHLFGVMMQSGRDSAQGLIETTETGKLLRRVDDVSIDTLIESLQKYLEDK